MPPFAEYEEEAEAKAAREKIRKAVEHERTRLWDKPLRRKLAETELGREYQKQMDCPSVIANRVVRARAKNILRSKEGEGGKPS